MNRLALGVALLLLLGSSARADDKPKQDPPPAQKDGEKKDASSPVENFNAAKKELAEADKAMNKVISDLRAKGEKLSLENKTLKEAFDAQNKLRQKTVAAAKEVVKADPKSDLGFEAITFVVNSGGPTADILKKLAEHHVNHPKIGSVLNRMAFGPPSKEAQDLMRAVMEKNQNQEAQGNAAFTLARMLMRSNKAEAEKLFERVAKDYKDIKYFRGTLGTQAEANLFELRHLQEGMEVPDIEGEDMDGVKFKLSDYRGKVVMLDFWGHW